MQTRVGTREIARARLRSVSACMLAVEIPNPSHLRAVQTLYPGVYDNVLAEPGSPVYDSSPHVWTYGEPCDITPDAPYSSYADAGTGGTSKLSFIGSVGVGGGQGNADCIYGSCDDHDTFGNLRACMGTCR